MTGSRRDGRLCDATGLGMETGMRRRVSGVVAAMTGLAASAAPVIASAQEAGSRAVEAPADSTVAMLAAAAGIVVIFLVATLGRLYQNLRGIRWRFQDPDPVQDEHHGGH